MAVQAPYWSNAFSHDFRGSARGIALEELPAQIGATVLSGPHSDLTCIASASANRKRARDDFTAPAVMDPLPPLPTGGFSSNPYANNRIAQMQRLLESRGTSTSGRPFSSLVPNGLVSDLHNFTMEIDTLIRVECERMRMGIEEATKRHCRGIVAVLEQQALRRMREVELRLERESRLTIELEEKLRQLTAENQVWFNAAQNSEAMLTALRSNHQALLSAAVAEELVAEDAQSCCYGDEDAADVPPGADVAARVDVVKPCRACGLRIGCMVLFPCRHLCLCKDCELTAATCPICGSSKNASLEANLS